VESAQFQAVKPLAPTFITAKSKVIGFNIFKSTGKLLPSLKSPKNTVAHRQHDYWNNQSVETDYPT